MSQRTVTLLEDDLDGSEAASTVRFGLDGIDLEMELSTVNEKGMRDILAPYIEKGRRLTSKGARRKPVPVGPSSSAVRAWAQSHDIPVSAKGRIPADVIRRFQEAGN